MPSGHQVLAVERKNEVRPPGVQVCRNRSSRWWWWASPSWPWSSCARAAVAVDAPWIEFPPCNWAFLCGRDSCPRAKCARTSANHATRWPIPSLTYTHISSLSSLPLNYRLQGSVQLRHHRRRARTQDLRGQQVGQNRSISLFSSLTHRIAPKIMPRVCPREAHKEQHNDPTRARGLLPTGHSTTLLRRRALCRTSSLTHEHNAATTTSALWVKSSFGTSLVGAMLPSPPRVLSPGYIYIHDTEYSGLLLTASTEL